MVLLRRVRSQIGLCLEERQHGIRGEVKLRQRIDPQNKLDRSENAVLVVERRIVIAAPGVSARDEPDRTMAIDMVHATLRIVFHHKDRSVFPKLALAYGFYD